MDYFPDFLIIPGQIIKDKDLKTLDGFVYGIVYWFSKLKMEKCIASNKYIANLLGTSANGVGNSINRLVRKKYVYRVMDEKNHRIELIPTIGYHSSLPLNLQIDPPSIYRLTPPQSTDGHISNSIISNIYKVPVSKDTGSQKLIAKNGKREESTCPNTPYHSRCIGFLKDLARQKNLPNGWINLGKQISFLHKILRAGYSFQKIYEVAKILDADKFMWDKWDVGTIAGQIERTGEVTIHGRV